MFRQAKEPRLGITRLCQRGYRAYFDEAEAASRQTKDRLSVFVQSSGKADGVA